MAAGTRNKNLVPLGAKNDLPLAKAESTSKSSNISVIPYIRNKKK